MTTRTISIQADLVLNIAAAQRQINRLSREGVRMSGVGGTSGSSRSANRGPELFSLIREFGRGLGLGGLRGAGVLGAGGALTAGVAGITALGVAAHRSSRLLGTSAYREFYATTVRLRYQWNLFAAQIGDIILPILSRFARTLTRIIGFFTSTRNAEGARASSFFSNLNPGFHAGGRVRQSGAYNLRQGEEVVANPRAHGESAGRGQSAIETGVYDALRRLVQDGTFDLFFARARLPNLIPQPVDVVSTVGVGTAGDVDLVDINLLSDTDFDALTSRSRNVLYLVTGVTTSSEGGGTGPGTGTVTPPPITPEPFTLSLPNPGEVDFHKGISTPQFQPLSAVVRSNNNLPDPNQWTYSIASLPDGIIFDRRLRRLRSVANVGAVAGRYSVTYTAIEVSAETTPTTLSTTFTIRIVAPAGEPPP